MEQVMQVATALAGLSLTATGAAGIALTIRDRIRDEFKDYRRQNIQFREPRENELVLGYNQVLDTKVPILADMYKKPHMLVSGLSQQGKSSMVEYAVRNKDNVIILNAPSDSFKSVDAIERIDDYGEMMHMLQYLITLKDNKEITYVVIDELLQLSIDGKKQIQELITKLLAKAAHYKIYVIGITQSAEKEIVKCKHLFNTRVCFNMVEESSYKVVLGYVPENPVLMPQEFFYLVDRQGRGRTYDLSL